MKKLTNKEKIYSYATIFVMIDQFVKILVRSKLSLHEEIVVIPKFFSLYHTTNTGAAFSLLSNHTTFLIIFTFFVLFLMDRYIKKEAVFTSLSRLSLGMIIGGILGNLIDRIVFHGVTDYLLFVFGNKSFPVFNIADILITVGVFIYFLYCLLEIGKNFKEKTKSSKTKEKGGE